MAVLVIDVGTSFVEVARVDLAGHHVSAGVRSLNKQVFFGTNVLARLSAALEGHAEDLQTAAHESVLDALALLSESDIAHCNADDILAYTERIIIGANSVMAPLFCGVVPTGLARAPFAPSEIARCESGALIQKWRRLRGDETRGAEMVQPIAAFVGGDARAVLVATGLNETGDDKAHLVVDLGTNAEILLRAGEDLYVASVPAGPTFEGVLSSGITGWRGTDVIAHLAQMRRIGALAGDGRVLDSEAMHPLTQEDVRDFQLAKAAVRAGIDALLKRVSDVCGHTVTLESFTLAGTFGAHLDLEAAHTIGLLPPGLPEPSVIGNESVNCAETIDTSNLDNAVLIGATRIAAGSPCAIAGNVIAVELARDEYYAETLLSELSII